ncbi:DUF1573 domain-containing protein [Crateriforma conspicua]|uniref:DUF1573 domain-containing protein n=1 Tax=Crateriforma conspicua TaxID=2527996 RepID=UPI001187EA6B|nr:DUF1573 domain-containing protein [Crateriforma conspicua]QDV61020.1 hypothetical protein Mal65_01410 [Crateriforma conspicua]
MSRFSKSLLATLGGLAFIGLVAASLTLIVRYKPYGVPDHRRAEYEARVAALRQHEMDRKQNADTAQPKATVDATRHHFGMLDPHVTATHQFRVTNQGEAPLTLDVTDTTCKCTVGNVQQKLLMPGESTDVTLQWNTGYQAEHYEQTARIETNDPGRPTIKLTIEGTIRARLVAPESIPLQAANPGQPNQGSFLYYSQLPGDVILENIQSDAEGLQWNVTQLDPTKESRLADAEAWSAWKVELSCVSASSGIFEIPATLTFRQTDNDETMVREATITGRVHQAISFHSPDIHSQTGLELGTMVNDRQHVTHVLVRQRDRLDRQLKVLKVEPESLQASMKPLAKEGNYRLTIEVPAGATPAIFNLDNKQGYVQVGDPDTPGLSNWFPVQGCVVELEKS